MTILLDCGSGGRASHRLVGDVFMKHFDNPVLRRMDDAACLDINGPIAMSTDSYTVTPLFFPGGDIGTLAVHGTVNDVAMLGARPRYLSCGFIIEEGLEMQVLENVVCSMAKAAKEAGVLIVTGDTKVMPKGSCDKLFINTTGIGELILNPGPSGRNAKPGDIILISGTLGDHGMTIMTAREHLSFTGDTKSDSAPLNHMVEALMLALGENVHVLRDPTRGGLATTLNEIALQSCMMCELEEKAIRITASVKAGCSLLGVDPLYLANEGKLICIVPAAKAEEALGVMRSMPYGSQASIIGRVKAPENSTKIGRVLLLTPLGGKRLLPMLEGAQLPRIC